jgi:hypothetical protein
MKTKYVVIVCVIIFLGIASFFVWKNDIRVQKAPTGTPVDQKFDHWRLGWEKQRLE